MQRIKALVLAHSRDRALKERIGQVGLNERQLAILSYVEAHGQITNRELQEFARVSHTVAHEELTALVEKGVLQKRGRGRATHYVWVDDF
jgi:ATP-dependent DNA helicase RecG